MKEIDVHQLKKKREQGEEIFLLDVRETFEYHIANIDGTLIPLDELEKRVEELPADKDTEIVVMCRSGKRSARAVSILQNLEYRDVSNLRGGILAWSKEIDPTVPGY